MKRDNKLGPAVLKELPKPREMSLSDLKAIDTSKIALIDARPWAAFRIGHVAGALFHPHNNSFVTDVGSMVTEHEDIVLIIEASKLDPAIRDLIRIGLDRIVGWMPPARIDELRAAGAALATIDEVSVQQAEKMMNGAATLLDVRRATEFAEGHIDGAINYSHTRVAAHLDRVPRDKPVLVN